MVDNITLAQGSLIGTASQGGSDAYEPAVLVTENVGNMHVPVVPLGSDARSAFGEFKIVQPTPQVQIKFPQGINPAIVQILTNKSGSSVSAANGLCTITCAGVAEAFSQIRSLDVIRYGPGQGMNARFTAGFPSNGVALSTLWAGPGDDDEMLGVGCNGTDFAILHRKFGDLEVRELQITAGGDAGGGTFTLTLDGTAITVTVPSGSATIADVVALIIAKSDEIFNAGRGWEVHTDDSINLTFTSLVAENATGTFSFADVDSGVTAGTFAQGTTALVGASPTETITNQADWNIDVMDGSGPSGMTLDATKLNVWDIKFQYLGGGNLFFSVENPETGSFTPIHMMKHAGSGTGATFRDPTFHLNMIAKTDTGYVGAAQTMITASMGGFIEGKEAHFGVRHQTEATVSTNGTTEVVNLVLHNEEIFNSHRNKVEVFPDHITCINDSTRSVKIEIFENPTHINSGVSLTAVDATTSVMLSGAGSGTHTGGTLLLTVSLTASQSKDLDIEHLGLKVRPGSTWIFVVTKGSGGTDGDVTLGASWLERI